MGKHCRIMNCKRPAISRGLCGRHYYGEVTEEAAPKNLPKVDITKLGAIYYAGVPGSPYIKIGVSYDPPKRISAMQTGNPFEVVLYGALWVEPAFLYPLESKSHRVLTEYGFHIRREWFDVPYKDGMDVARKLAADNGWLLFSSKRYGGALLNSGLTSSESLMKARLVGSCVTLERRGRLLTAGQVL